MNHSDLPQRLTARLAGRILNSVQAGDARPAGVLVPLFQQDGIWKVLFTKRTEQVVNHKGQISFPGGAKDPGDEDLLATALRESEEEIGLDRTKVQVIGPLDPIKTITNYLIHPFVGIIPFPYPFRLNSQEVERLICLPLADLIQEASSQRPEGVGLNLTFNRFSEVIWGATARILYQFLDVAFLKED